MFLSNEQPRTTGRISVRSNGSTNAIRDNVNDMSKVGQIINEEDLYESVDVNDNNQRQEEVTRVRQSLVNETANVHQYNRTALNQRNAAVSPCLNQTSGRLNLTNYEIKSRPLASAIQRAEHENVVRHI